MISRTSMRVFAENAATRPAYGTGADQYTAIDSSKGYVDVDVHVGQNAVTRVQKFDDFASIRIASGTGIAGVSVHITPDQLDQAVALRDAANAAIRHLRKLAKEV